MSVGTTQTRQGLGGRLAALARIVELGPGKVEPKLLTDSGQLLLRAGDRLKLSSDHTVVALAGGTGSGKSTLFNSISGLELSPTGVRRPTTARTHACVWGLEGAGPLLDWLQIQWRHRFARASALDKGESQLHGLILLDLPDHDSIRALHRHRGRPADPGRRPRRVGARPAEVRRRLHASALRDRSGRPRGGDDLRAQPGRPARPAEELAECVADLDGLLRREGVENPMHRGHLGDHGQGRGQPQGRSRRDRVQAQGRDPAPGGRSRPPDAPPDEGHARRGSTRRRVLRG